MLRVVQIGLGPIGRGIAERLLATDGVSLVGVADSDPALVGHELGELLGGAGSRLRVQGSVAAMLDATPAEVALHATGSHLVDVSDQLRELLARGLAVVSTCEELSYPFYRHAELSARLHELAGRSDAVLLGTGVNPGFVMDKLVVTLLAACDRVDHVRVVREVDASTRRGPFQHKIGAGITAEEFERRRVTGRFGHIGLEESAHMLGDGMAVGKDRVVRNELRPVIAREAVRTPHVDVAPGQVAGIDQTVTIEAAGVERVRMELRMYVGAPAPFDAVIVAGSPPLEMKVTTGVPGDEATAAIAVACARRVRLLAPGLRTMLDLPLRPALRSSG